jgi:hypothetical protein
MLKVTELQEMYAQWLQYVETIGVCARNSFCILIIPHNDTNVKFPSFYSNMFFSKSV